MTIIPAEGQAMSNVLRRLSGALIAVVLTCALAPVQGASATAYQPLNGDGSSWAGPAIDQWSRDVRNQGIVINFNPDGSAAGRSNYTLNQADFAATDIQYLTQGDPFGGGVENPYSVAYSYVPIVAGGTSFLYNLSVGGRKVTDLRLSGDTITKIFTGQITNWDDSRITKDYGHALPSQQITVVTRSDGSGASYQFTRWMSKQYTSQWDHFCGSHGGPSSNCGPTEFYPGFQGSQQRNGSDQVANYVSASYGQGSIAYDEYAYALQSSIPVAKVLNAAGYYTLPTPSNVAIALQTATIDENPASLTFLIQNLDHVYSNPDPRTYPLSSYSYLIVPRNSRVHDGNSVGPPSRFNTVRGATLSTWLNYVLCGAQQSAGQLGYSPLPKNLVVGGFHQTSSIPGHVATPNLNNLNNCNNPTYHNGVNYLIKQAPFPPECDKAGSAQTCGSGGGTSSGPTSSAGGSGGSGGGGSTGGTSNSTAGGTSNGGGTTEGSGSGAGTATPGGGFTQNGQGGTTATGNGGARAVTIDPDTGKTLSPGGAGAQAASGGQIYAVPVAVTGRSGDTGLFGTLAAVEILAAVLVPGLFGSWLHRRRRAR